MILNLFKKLFSRFPIFSSSKTYDGLERCLNRAQRDLRNEKANLKRLIKHSMSTFRRHTMIKYANFGVKRRLTPFGLRRMTNAPELERDDRTIAKADSGGGI